MREKRLFILYILSVVMLCVSVCPVLAKAPDTPKIIFGTHREEEGNRELYLINPDGSELVNITNNRADDVSGTWSPTGEQILFASDRDRFLGSWDLYLMDADGENVRPVFEKSAARNSPVWNPDGKGLAYSQRVGNWETHVFKIMLADGPWELLTDIGLWNSPDDWFDPAYALPVSPQPQLLTTTWGKLKK